MKRPNPGKWSDVFLPQPKRVNWTWKRWLLLALATCVFVDQFFVRGYDDRSAEGILVLILAFRAVPKSELPVLVLVAGAAAAVLTSATFHQLLGATSILWTLVIGLLVLTVMFWHRGKRERVDAVPDAAAADSHSVLHLGDKNS